jgi:hypothetical protein
MSECPIHYRKANLSDLKRVVELLQEDELGATREQSGVQLDPRYEQAFQLIDQDSNQSLTPPKNT